MLRKDIDAGAGARGWQTISGVSVRVSTIDDLFVRLRLPAAVVHVQMIKIRNNGADGWQC